MCAATHAARCRETGGGEWVQRPEGGMRRHRVILSRNVGVPVEQLLDEAQLAPLRSPVQGRLVLLRRGCGRERWSACEVG